MYILPNNSFKCDRILFNKMFYIDIFIICESVHIYLHEINSFVDFSK